MLALLVVFGFLLSRSLFGFRLKAIGGNRAAAELARLPVAALHLPRVHHLRRAWPAWPALLDFSFIGSASPNDGQSTCSRCSPR